MSDELERLSVNETNALLKAIDDTRDRAIVILFLNTGIFITELTSLKFDDVKWDKKILSVPGTRKREISLNDQVYDALAKWSKERPDKRTSALFVTTKGQVKDLSIRSVDHLIRKYAEQAGIKKRVNSQILRNTFAVRLFSEETAIDKASAILGISDSESINRYIQASKRPAEEVSHAKEIERIDTRHPLIKKISKMFPVKPKPASPVIEVKGSMVPILDDVIFGRESVVAEIRSDIAKGQSVLLTGPIGIGKTHLLKYISTSLGRQALYISSPSPLKNMLTQILDKLDVEWKGKLPARASTRDIADYIAKIKGSKPPVLIIDNMGGIKISDVDALLNLLANFTILAAADETKPKLKQIWWKFKQIELASLGEKPARELIKHLTQNLSISDYEMLETRLLTLSNGLPLAIVDMVGQLSHMPSVTKDAIRDVYHEAGVHYRDWTNVILFIYWIAVVFRFIALGTHSYESYFLAGFGVTLLMILKNVMSMLR
jgi:hypothetical protein